MNIDSINNGIVLDHITAGKSMQIYKLLNLDRLDCSVAIIKNVKSSKMGRKDIIKIDEAIDVNLDVLGYLDPDITVNIIRNGVRIQKLKLSPPEELVNVISCKNPRCITTTEPQIPQIFYLSGEDKPVYRCRYCDSERK
ncbi:MAG: aspartate carbamoyltransferase regulatory subunit [Clostridia bacterium]|nr:aspartate carbamoyltransferase regulatory subunit [Clostridia bacterium]